MQEVRSEADERKVPHMTGSENDSLIVSDDQGQNTIDDDLAVVRPRLIQAMLPHVAFDGWSKAALLQAAQDIGLNPDIAAIAFPRGAIQMVDHFLAAADQAMLEAAEQELQNVRVRDRFAGAIRIRLQQTAAHREAVRRAVTLLALPQHAPAATRLAWRTADAIWYAAGDDATDFNHYTKRLSAMAVYTSTLIYWLGDDSDDHADTLAFLDRRIANVLGFHKLKGRLQSKKPAIGSAIIKRLGRWRYAGHTPESEPAQA